MTEYTGCGNLWAAKAALGLRTRKQKHRAKPTLCLNMRGRPLLLFQIVERGEVSAPTDPQSSKPVLSDLPAPCKR